MQEKSQTELIAGQVPKRSASALKKSRMNDQTNNRTGLDPISDRGAIPTTSRTGCCPGADLFSPVGVVGDSVRPVSVEGSWPKDGLVSDWDLVWARDRNLYEFSDIVLMLRNSFNTLSSTIVYY